MPISKRKILCGSTIILLILIGFCLVCADDPTRVTESGLKTPNPVTPVNSNSIIAPPAVTIPSPSSKVSAPDHVGCRCCNESVSAEASRNIRNQAVVAREVDAISQEINANGWDWIAGPTSVMFKSDEYRQKLRGLDHSNPPSQVVKILSEPSAAVVKALPVSFDWRNKNGNWLTPVRDQGYCGSCWAFAVTGAFESYWERKLKKPNLNPNFAEQALVSCALDQDGCGGGLFTSMAYFVNKNLGGAVGTVLESAYPYLARDSSCKNLAGVTRYKADPGGRWGYVGGGTEWTIPSVNAIKAALYTYGPIPAGVYADNKFDSYMGGIFSSRPTDNSYWANHAVLIVGWGVYNGRSYWIVKNSWGTGWGENGYFRIYTNQNRIGEGAVFFTPPRSPVISSISPSTGTKSKNTNVAIVGSNFRAGAKVHMISETVIKQASISGITNTKITCTLPTKGQKTGYWNIRVRNTDGTLTTKQNGFYISG